MTKHEFKCDNCNTTVDSNTTKNIQVCPQCGRDMRYVFKGHCRANYEHPIHSDALAISPDQRAEHERLFPNIRLDEENRPIFDNVRNHDAYLKATGFIKLPQKSKRLGRKRIYP